MYRFSTYKRQYKANLKLALPVVLTQLGQILKQVADNLMVGRYGGDAHVPLDTVSLGGSVFIIHFNAAIGIALGMTPLVGEHSAQGDREKSAGLLQHGILIYTLLGGIAAEVWTAAIQGIILIVGALACAAILTFTMPEDPGQLFEIAAAHGELSFGSFSL